MIHSRIDKRVPWFVRPLREPRPVAQDLLLRVVDCGIGGSLLVLPWFPDAEHPYAQLSLVVLAVITGLAWFLRTLLRSQPAPWFRSPADGIFLACAALVLLQLAPLAPAVLEVLAPHTRELLPLWMPNADGAARLGVWYQISLDPAATQSGLVLLVAYGLIFFAALQRIGQLEDVERLLRWLAVSVSIASVFAIATYLTTAPGAARAQERHILRLLALGVGPVLWCVQRSWRQPQSELERLGDRPSSWPRLAWVLTLVGVLFAGTLSLAAGPVAVLAAAALVGGGLLYRAKLLSRQVLGTMIAALAVIGGLVAIYGSDPAMSPQVWKNDARATADFCVFGSGVGTHRDIERTYRDLDQGTAAQAAHSGYLSVALEAGIPGVALLSLALAHLGACGVAAVRQSRSGRLSACAAAVCAGLLATVGLAVIDSAWNAPAATTAELILAACALRLRQIHQEQPARTWTIARPLTLAGAAAVALAGVWMVNDRVCASLAAPHWEAYRQFAASPEARAGAAQPTPEVIEHLRQIVRWTPDDARARLRLADCYLRWFDASQLGAANRTPLAQLRDAAMSSEFATPEALDAWLAHAVGEDRRLLYAAAAHAHRALASCPLEGEGYADLAELAFLDGPQHRASEPLVAQGLRVRPYDGTVLLCAGNERALAEDFAGALGYWRRAFATGPKAQRAFIDLWAGARLPVAVVLAEFHPDRAAARLLAERYAELGQADESQVVRAYYMEFERDRRSTNK